MVKNPISVVTLAALIIIAIAFGLGLRQDRTTTTPLSSPIANSNISATATFDPNVDRSQIVTVVVVTSPPDDPQVTVDPKATDVVATPTPPQGEPTDPKVIEDHTPVLHEEPEFNPAKECPAPGLSDLNGLVDLDLMTFEEKMMLTQYAVVADVIREGEVFEYGGSKDLASWYQRWHLKLVEDWSPISPSPAEFTVILPVSSTKQIEGKRNWYLGTFGTKLQAGKRYIMILSLVPLAEKHGYPNAEFALYDGSALEIVGDKACPTAMIAVAKYRYDGIPYPQTVADVKAAIMRGIEARIKLNPTPFVPDPPPTAVQ